MLFFQKRVYKAHKPLYIRASQGREERPLPGGGPEARAVKATCSLLSLLDASRASAPLNSSLSLMSLFCAGFSFKPRTLLMEAGRPPEGEQVVRLPAVGTASRPGQRAPQPSICPPGGQGWVSVPSGWNVCPNKSWPSVGAGARDLSTDQMGILTSPSASHVLQGGLRG